MRIEVRLRAVHRVNWTWAVARGRVTCLGGGSCNTPIFTGQDKSRNNSIDFQFINFSSSYNSFQLGEAPGSAGEVV